MTRRRSLPSSTACKQALEAGLHQRFWRDMEQQQITCFEFLDNLPA